MVKLKDIPSVDRPREKLLKYGSKKLTNSELLAIILRTGTKSMNAKELSSYMLKTIGLSKFKDISLSKLTTIKGIGEAKAVELLAVVEFGKRLLRENEVNRIVTAESVFESFRDLGTKKKEHFVAIYLDTRNSEIAREVISVGTLNSSLVHPREVFEPAIRYVAHSVIVAHNHPSGDLTPSHEDVLLTKKLVDAGKLLDIRVLDHVILGQKGFFSFKEKGLL